ncbi:MAG TPA: PQQ-binding-like beta-propeller repeat protein [Actinomycetota bacterium]
MSVAVLLSLSVARAQSRAPEWSQFQGSPAHAGETSAADGGPAPPYRVRWTLPAPDGTSLSGAAIVGSTAVTVGREAVYGVDLASGEVVWEVERDEGPLSVPAVGEADGRIVLLYLEGPPAGATPSPTPTPTPTPTPSPGSEEPADVGSSLVALDIEDRAERWRADLGAVARSGVTVDAGTAYVSDQAGVVHAVGLDGVERWTAQVGGRADLPLATGDGHVYAVSRDPDERRVAITALAVEDGERLWRVSPQIGSTAVSAPAAVDGGVVVGTADRLVRKLGADDGEERWNSLALSLFSPVSSPATGGGAVLVADIGGGLYLLDPGDGSRRWGFQFNELILRSSPVRSGGVALVGLNDGRLGAVDLETGRLVWRGGPTPGLVGTIAVSGDAVVAVKGGPEAGLIAFEHDPAATLVDAPSPTELALGTTLARASLAALAVFVVAYGLGLLGRRRFGDAFGPEEVGEPEEEA